MYSKDKTGAFKAQAEWVSNYHLSLKKDQRYKFIAQLTEDLIT